MRDDSHLDPAPPVEAEPSHAGATRIAPAGLARNAVSVFVFSLVAYYALFRLPFRFPPRIRLMSPSYAFGFNNTVAILAMAGLLGAVTLLYLLRRREANDLRIAFPRERAVDSRRPARIAFVIAALCYAALTFLMYIYNQRSAPWLMWETRHLLHRTWLMDVYGMHPYTEVAAEYGPILTYAPSWMYWLFRPMGGSHQQAYFACHLLLNVAGLWCAYYVLSRTVMPGRARLTAFVILAIAGFAPYMGLNGALLRYLFPFASLLLGHRAIALMRSRWGGIRSFPAAAMVVLLLLAGNILLSSETGVAFAIAWLGYALLKVCGEVFILTASFIAFVAAALLCWLFLPTAYYSSLLRFSEGANNLPLLPAPHLLFYILTLFLLVPSLLAISVRHWWTGNESGAAICGALGILCVVMAPGALGRCDPPHVLLFGMGASMLLMIRLANTSRAAFTAYALAYAAIFIVFIEAVNLIVFYGISPQLLLSRHPFSNVIHRLRNATGKGDVDLATLSALDRYPRLGLPFASYGDPTVETYVLSRGKVEPEYYVCVVGVYSEAALAHKLRDVAKAEYLLVPRNLQLPGESCAGYLKSLRQWFLYPAKLPCRAEPLDPAGAVKSFISDHYIPVEQVGSWSVLRRVSTASPIDP
jgi:hypothetical protein